MWALPSPKKAMVKPSSCLRSLGPGKSSLLALMWTLKAKSSAELQITKLCGTLLIHIPWHSWANST